MSSSFSGRAGTCANINYVYCRETTFRGVPSRSHRTNFPRLFSSLFSILLSPRTLTFSIDFTRSKINRHIWYSRVFLANLHYHPFLFSFLSPSIYRSIDFESTRSVLSILFSYPFKIDKSTSRMLQLLYIAFHISDDFSANLNKRKFVRNSRLAIFSNRSVEGTNDRESRDSAEFSSGLALTCLTSCARTLSQSAQEKDEQEENGLRRWRACGCITVLHRGWMLS